MKHTMHPIKRSLWLPSAIALSLWVWAAYPLQVRADELPAPGSAEELLKDGTLPSDGPQQLETEFENFNRQQQQTIQKNIEKFEEDSAIREAPSQPTVIEEPASEQIEQEGLDGNLFDQTGPGTFEIEP